MGNCFGSHSPPIAAADPNPATPAAGDMPSPRLKIFAYSELRSATRNFRADMALGVGGFGTVYKGWVDKKTLAPSKLGVGMPVAIKKLNQESLQGFNEWQSEVNFLGTLSHPNLVRLMGYCREDTELLLVYEFMPRGSLENHLFRKGAAFEPLSWDLRLKISIGAAKGLAFLHASEKQIIYRDFKASNILLDESYNAKISDFGLAKLGPAGGESHVTTRIMGTQGYAAPEYIATGLKAMDTNRPNGLQNLVEWKKPFLSQRRELRSNMDARIKGQYSTKAAFLASRLTQKCLESEPRKRPSMKEVLDELEQIASIPKPKHCRSRPLHLHNFPTSITIPLF